VKIQLCKDSVPSRRIKATQNFFRHNTPDTSAHRNGNCIQQIWIHCITQLGIPCNNLSVKEGVSRMQTSKSSECYHRQMAWCRHQTARIRKAIKHQKKHLAYKRQRKWWTAFKNCFIACDAILFVSRLIQKCFKRKFLHVFADVRSLQKCFCVDSLWPFGLITHAYVRDVFFAPPGFCHYNVDLIRICRNRRIGMCCIGFVWRCVLNQHYNGRNWHKVLLLSHLFLLVKPQFLAYFCQSWQQKLTANQYKFLGMPVYSGKFS